MLFFLKIYNLIAVWQHVFEALLMASYNCLNLSQKCNSVVGVGSICTESLFSVLDRGTLKSFLGFLFGLLKCVVFSHSFSL